MTRIEAVISDFGGVLTTPLVHGFAAFQEESGIPVEAFGQALGRLAERDGVNPLFVLEKGEMTEAEFLARVEGALREVLGREVTLEAFGERYFAALAPNEELFAHYRALHRGGLRLAMLTNNVREWEPRWRAMLPIDEIFDLVVDSAFVGMRKPEAGIYALTLERLGLPARACAFVDDLEVNVAAARELGFHGVHFRETAQAIEELKALTR